MALEGIVSLVLAIAAAASCGGGSDGAPEAGGTKTDAGDAKDAGDQGPDETPLTCDTPLADYTSNLKPATPVDYVDLRTLKDGQTTPGDLPPFYGKSGTPCSTASDPTLCQAALDHVRLREGGGWDVPSLGKGFLVFTRGEEVGVIDSPDDLITFLGIIDTLEEARLLLGIREHALTCQTTPFETGWKRTDDAGWEFTIDEGDSCHTKDIVEVSSNGEVTLLDTEVMGTDCPSE